PDRSSGGGLRRAGVGGATVGPGLVLAAGAGGQPLVSQHAPVPPAPVGRLARSLRPHGRGSPAASPRGEAAVEFGRRRGWRTPRLAGGNRARLKGPKSTVQEKVWGRHSCLPWFGRQECLPHVPNSRI